MMNRDLLLQLVSAGITAPSPDNSQPWKFILQDNAIELRLDKKHLGMFFDAGNYGSLLGCGGVIENIRLTSARHGLQAKVIRHETSEPDLKVARIEFHKGDADIDPLSHAVDSRCSYRGYFNRNPVSPEILHDIENIANDMPTARILWLAGKERKDVTRILIHTDRLRYTHRILHHDFHSILRYGKEIGEKRDGLAANTLGLERIFTLALPISKPWTVARALNLFGMHYFTSWRGATVPLHNAEKIGALIMSRTIDPVDQGVALQRVWLAINSHNNLNCQLFGALPLFIYRMQECNGSGFNEKQQRFLQTNISELNDLIGLDPDSERPIAFFRLGYPRQRIVRSLRRPVESFVMN